MTIKQLIEQRRRYLEEEFCSYAKNAIGRATDALANAELRGYYGHHAGFNLGNDAKELMRVGAQIEELNRVIESIEVQEQKVG